MLGPSRMPRRPQNETENSLREQVRPRRKRGDTIRASDFARASTVCPTPLAAAVMLTGPSTRSSTRRTRSGTVTLAPPGPISTLRAADQGNPTTVGDDMNKAKGRRRKALPTIKMKIDDFPLPPQGSDEEDDELLLTGKARSDN